MTITDPNKLLPQFASPGPWTESEEAHWRQERAKWGCVERPIPVLNEREPDRILVFGHGLELRDKNLGGSESKFFH